MVFLWPLVHAVLAVMITTGDVLPPTSRAYDYFPSHLMQKVGKNATLPRIVREWIADTWRWNEPSLNPSVALTWVNGINYTSAEVAEQAAFLSALFGCRVRPYYNPSLGWWLRDLACVSFMYIRSPTEDPVVTGLAKHLTEVLTEVGDKGRVVHLAHSGGALLTYLVAKYHLSEDLRKRIDVINFGGARSITQKYFGKAINYYARNDPILLVNRRAKILMQQVMNQTDGEVIYLKHNTSFVFLKGRAGDGLADHSFVGPTYLTALHKEAAVFRRHYYRAYWFEGLIVGKPENMTWGRHFRKRAAAATGRHNFFSNSTIVRYMSDATSSLYQRQVSYWYGNSSTSNSTSSYWTFRRKGNGTRKGYWKRRKNKRNATATSYLTSLSNSSYLHSLANVNMTSSMTAISEDLSSKVRSVRKTAARLTGMRHFFSPTKRKESPPLLALPSSRGRRNSSRRRLIHPDLPLSAYLELNDEEDEDDSEWDDEELALMNVQEMSSKYFTP